MFMNLKKLVKIHKF